MTITANSLIKLDSQSLRVLVGPIVYGWYRAGEYLYIGFSGKGLSRVANHNVIGKVEPFLITDELHFFPCATGQDAIANEMRLLRSYRPKFNKTIPNRSELEHFEQYKETHVILASEPKNAANGLIEATAAIPDGHDVDGAEVLN
jgi:hypothetical protein